MRQAVFSKIFLYLPPGDGEQRADDTAPYGRDAAESPEPRTPYQV